MVLDKQTSPFENPVEIYHACHSGLLQDKLSSGDIHAFCTYAMLINSDVHSKKC